MTFARTIAALGAAFACAAACVTSSPQATLCKDVPAGGCPLSNGVACDDPSCEAAYACNPDGTWSLDHVCPARDGGADASDGAPDDVTNAGFDVSDIDAPPGAGGGPGCPAPEAPDCWLATALECPAGSSDPCCGCDALFVCSNGAQVPWGYCSADGGIVYAP